MERKRKLPARAAARVEQANKKRNVTPREKSATPATPKSPSVKEPTPPPPPPPLPLTVESGRPLPVIEDAQPEDLSGKDFKTLQESGVMAESLARSRHKWLSEGLFEKYWTKPHKRKGVLQEDPKNPPKDSMTKVGTISITIEPHIVEATMFVVKDPKSRVQQQQTPTQASQPRPVLQYGPPNGSMPPPPTPTAGSAVPASPSLASPVAPGLAAPSPGPNAGQPPHTGPPGPSQSSEPPKASGMQAPAPAPPPLSVSNGTFTGASGPTTATAGANTAPVIASPAPAPSPQPPRPAVNAPQTQPTRPGAGPSGSPATNTATSAPSSSAGGRSVTPAGTPATPAAPAAPAAKPAANDPVIALLAQKASGDPELRDLMKRVAVGQAKDGELAHFQKIIDQLNAEYKRKGGQQGPSADRLLVDGKTVKYFADEVRTILDIVLASNPNQKSSELRPPPRSDPLVVLLVKTALEDQRTKDMIRRIAEGRPGFTDATDLKEILDRLHRDAKPLLQSQPAVQPAKHPMPNGVHNAPAKAPAAPQQQTPQALRSKGPPPASRPDVTAVVFDFGGGDRYLFPKYSILEFLPAPSGQQVVASFLIVRKGSTSEYGGDPKLDYYQPVTIRLSTPTGRCLENLARVVAPQDEVRRYMDDIMDNMTRAEYVLLAMRLPRYAQDGEHGAGTTEEPKTNGSTPKVDTEPEPAPAATKPAVLWTSKASDAAAATPRTVALDPEEETQLQYQKLIQSVAQRDPELI